MSDEDVVHTIWDSVKIKCGNLHQQSSIAVETVLNESMVRKTLDNVTAVMITLEGFQKATFPRDISPIMDRTTPLPPKPSTETLHDKVANTVIKQQASVPIHSLKKSIDLKMGKDTTGKLEEAAFDYAQTNNIQPNRLLLSAVIRKNEPQKGDYIKPVSSIGSSDPPKRGSMIGKQVP